MEPLALQSRSSQEIVGSPSTGSSQRLSPVGQSGACLGPRLCIAVPGPAADADSLSAWSRGPACIGACVDLSVRRVEPPPVAGRSALHSPDMP
ncbi:hypothetical protein FAGKG844_10351 [Frankia sp. AgKG'84/4]